MTDARLQSPATARNREPIFEILQATLPKRARVLELASGSGEHAVHFARAMPGWDWQPSDTSADALASIDAWRQHEELGNVRKAIALDVTRDTWPAGPFDAVVAINLIHIAPWSVTDALMTGAAHRLMDGGILALYGPYMRNGQHTAASNQAFDADLKARNPEWGVRDLADVSTTAANKGLALEQITEMPANNLAVLFRARVA